MDPILKDYIKKGIDVEKAGLKVDVKCKTELGISNKFDENPDLKTAFKG